jgi:protocatechuate 3,4-dioxygenase beta subunit
VLARGGAVVSGIVRDVRARPIAGATVHVGPGRAELAASATTDANGAFTVTTVAGDATVYATATGFVDADVSVSAPAAGVVVELTPESKLSGTVVTAATHEPVADATVSAGGEHAVTDDGGHFEIAKLSPGRYKPVATAIGGYGEASESVRVSLGTSADAIVIELHPVAAVIGTIVIGKAGASGAACPPNDGEVSLTRYGSSQSYRAKTIVDGTVILEGVVAGTYEVSVGCKGYLPELPYADLAIGDSDLPDQVWHVAEGARVSGVVVDGARVPVAGAMVNHVDSGGLLAGTVVCDEHGAFTIAGVAPGVVDLTAHADGFAREDRPTRVTAAVGAVPAPVTLVLARGGTIEGVVVDEGGAPVAGAQVRSDGASGDERTDARGEFAFTALTPGDYEVYLPNDWMDLSLPARVKTVVSLERAAHVRLVQPAASGTLSGVIVDERGAPVRDAYVDAARYDHDTTRPNFHDPEVLTGLDGSFAFSALPPGSYWVRARHLGGGEVTTAAPVAVGSASVRLVLGATGVLAGVVTMAAGGAVADDVTVTATDRARDRERSERLFHTGGRFALRELPAGTYKLVVDDDPRSAIEVTIGDGEVRGDLTLVAQVRYTVRGRLVDAASGAPLVGWRVDAPRLEIEEQTRGRSLTVSQVESGLTDGDGRFLIRNMPSGPLEITCSDVSRDPEAPARAVTTATLAGANPLIDLGDVHPGAAAD